MIKTLDLKKNQTIIITKSQDFQAIFRGQKKQKRKAIIRFKFVGKNINSNISIKNVLFDNSIVDLELILEIPKGSKGTNTYMKIESMIFSPSASLRVIPSLEIQESEVKAGHAATVKRINAEYLYYMKSRGITEHESKELIIDGFLASGD